MVRAMSSQRGQVSLVLVVGLVVLALGMYTTFTLSRTIYEKIRLQNAADATAYSIATREARAFNFTAFANRTQVASYVQLLEEHGDYSRALYAAAMLGFWGDFLQSFGNAFPAQARFVVAFGQTFTSLYDAYMQIIHFWMKPKLIAKATAVRLTNTGYFALSAAMVLSAAAQAANGDFEIARRNDPRVVTNELSSALNALNTLRFAVAIDAASFAPELVDETSKLRAQRLITELVNASRYGTRSPNAIVDRLRDESVDSILNAIIAPGFADAMMKLNDTLIGGGGGVYVGTSKMVRDIGVPPQRPPLEQTGYANPDWSYLNPGPVMMSKDTVTPSRLSDTGVASLTSSSNGSTVCYYDRQQVPGYGTARHFFELIADPTAHGFVCEQDDWIRIGGIGRYVGYGAPRNPFGTTTGTAFNQPDVWIFLGKQNATGFPGGTDLRFTIARGSERADFDATPDGVFSGFVHDMTALSRAQVYYHRPGAWQEPPNLFNPYWNARLAPKADALAGLAGDVGLSGAFLDLLADNVTMF